MRFPFISSSLYTLPLTTHNSRQFLFGTPVSMVGVAKLAETLKGNENREAEMEDLNLSETIRLKKLKDVFLKNNISRQVKKTSGHMEAFVTLMTKTIPKKNTLKEVRLEFVGIVWTKIGPAHTANFF